MGSIAVLVAHGCSGEPPLRGNAGKMVTSLNEIAGSWDIASFQGYTPKRLQDGVRRAYVHVSPDRLAYAIECNSSGNAAHIDLQGTLHDDEGGRNMTLMGCPAEQARRDSAFFGFFATKPKVRWAGPQRVEMSNGTTKLLLEKPELRRLSFLVPPTELAGRWVPRTATGLNPATGSTGESFGHPSLVVITPSSLSYSGCGGARFTFRYTREGRMAHVTEDGYADCGVHFASTTLLKIMRSNPLVERDTGGLTLTAGDYAVILEPEAAMLPRKPLRSLPDQGVLRSMPIAPS
jgi:hypothetical protein